MLNLDDFPDYAWQIFPTDSARAMRNTIMSAPALMALMFLVRNRIFKTLYFIFWYVLYCRPKLRIEGGRRCSTTSQSLRESFVILSSRILLSLDLSVHGFCHPNMFSRKYRKIQIFIENQHKIDRKNQNFVFFLYFLYCLSATVYG